MSNAASARSTRSAAGPSRQGQAQSEAQRAADQLKQAGKTLEGDSPSAGRFRSRRSRRQGLAARRRSSRITSSVCGAISARVRTTSRPPSRWPTRSSTCSTQWNQLQKQMQQTARDIATTQPGVSKNLRDTMGRSQQEEVAHPHGVYAKKLCAAAWGNTRCCRKLP